MSRHIQFESRLSLTGSNADLRIPMKPSQLLGAITSLYNKVVGGGVPDANFAGPGNAVDRAARELKKAPKGKTLVVSGINDVAVQTVIKSLNDYLGNYGTTIDMDMPSNQSQGNDAAMNNFVKTVGSAKTVIFLDDANPVYDYAGGATLATALAKVPTTIAFVTKENETSKACKFALAQTHFMEAWDDANPKGMYYSIQQPLVRPLWDSRSWQACLLKWTGEKRNYYDYLKDNWEASMFPMASGSGNFTKFWNDTVRDGFFMGRNAAPAPAPVADAGADVAGDIVDEDVVVEEGPRPLANLQSSAQQLVDRFKKVGESMELVIYQKNYILDGSHTNNPWLMEMPDPISKVTWDNYVSIPYGMAQSKGWGDGDKVTVAVGDKSVVLPIIVQPGQANNSVAIAVGYGRGEVAGKVGGGVGANVFPMISGAGQSWDYSVPVSLNPTGESIQMAKTQTFIGTELQAEGGDEKREQIEDRVSDYILKETTIEEYKAQRSSGNKRPSPHHMLSLWDIHDKKGHHWAMAIDLNACTGCGSCIVSCNAENNIATVGRQEVLNRREMHWMRIDRYFKGSPDAQDGSLQMMHQPMLCQHCDNAPCESVCPVLATVHSSDGLNQQVYNRCIGTRYCANNCPYKVRRFNWFSYYWNDDFKDVNPTQHDKVGRLVLNPDVTVRARGVMEKCSFCVQRIQEKKLQAKVEKRKLKDGEIKTACSQSCPTGAIVFGDLNEKDSEIQKLYFNKRGYHALEDVKTLPSVLYMTKVRNTEKPAGAPAGGGESHGEGETHHG